MRGLIKPSLLSLITIIMVLLSVESKNTNEKGTILELWEIGGRKHTVMPPFQPYCYSLKIVHHAKAEKKKLLSDMSWHTVWKCEFRDTNLLEANRNNWTVEDTFPFKQRIGIDVGYKFPSDYPRILAWDIETATAGISPDWRRDKIISIATWGNTDESHKFFHGDRKDFIPEFIDFFNKYDPDVPTDFFGRFYDIPTLKQNCLELGIPCKLGRDGSQPYIIKKEFERKGKGKIEHTVRINGRVHFDVSKEVENDYTLTLAGLKNRGLKEVAKHYGLNPVVVDYSQITKMPIEKLQEYNLSDARCTYEICQIYLRGLFELAEYTNIPLDMIVNRQPSHIGNFVIGREFQPLNIISDGENMKRFPQFFKEKRSNEGAFILCYKTGCFFNPVHNDFNSMYVNIMRAFNLSPETVSLLAIKPYTGRYNFVVKHDYAIIEVPDKYHGQVVCKIAMADGVLRKILDEIVKQRAEYKKLWKETGDTQYWSKENSRKLVGNALYGYNLMSHSKYGNVLVGVLVAAIGRYMIHKAVEQEEQAGNVPLEVDTDGIWLEETNQTQFETAKHFPSQFKVEYLTMSREQYQGIILIDEKSYILKDSRGKITKHGSGILGRHIPPILDDFVNELSQAIFEKRNTNDVLRTWNKNRIQSYSIEAFVSYVTLSKRPETYKQTTLYHNLVETLRKHRVQPSWGDKINYVKTLNGYTPTIVLKATDQIDTRYYQGRMAYITSRILKKPFKEIREFFDGQIMLRDFGWDE